MKRIKMAQLQVRYEDGTIESWDANPQLLIEVFPDECEITMTTSHPLEHHVGGKKC